MKFYIAFSIHGTNKFKVAVINKIIPTNMRSKSREEQIKTVLGDEFSFANSRRMDYDESHDGIKVHWKGLLNAEGRPLKSASWLSRRMKQLTQMGWKLVPTN